MLSFDVLNFLIAVLALLVALYSIHYTQKMNKRKIIINNGGFYGDDSDSPIARFEIHNISPVPITVLDIAFLDECGNSITPLIGHEPPTVFSSGAYNIQIPNIIPDYKYADELDSPCVLQPYSSIELGYYFEAPYLTMNIEITCAERIHNFKKTQSFSIHFADIDD